MSNLNSNDKRILEKLFQMEGGYVLNFSNRTFDDFFNTTFNIDIYDEKYEGWSGSKASRLRKFWEIEDDKTISLLIHELIKYIGNEILLENLKMKDFPDKLIIRADEIANNLYKNEDQATPIDKKDEEFLEKEFIDIQNKIKNTNQDTYTIIDQRIVEAQKCIENNCPLAAIFLIASTLEGILLDQAQGNSQLVMNSQKVPTDKQNNKIPIDKWTLNNLITICTDVNILSKNSSYYGVQLRSVRNFIHPREQLRQGFNPNLYLAKMSLQALNSCLDDIDNFEKNKK